MRSFVALAIGVLALSSVANAQTPPAPEADHGYVEGVLQSAFGNVTSQSFGAEVGVTVIPNLQAFGEFGKVRDVATTGIGSAAQLIAGFLSQTQTGVSFSVKEPVTFAVGGGAMWPVWQRLVVDVQFRFGRILAEDGGINVSRAGIGVGVRF